MNYDIFLTNDDGIGSPGLLAAARALASLGSLLVVAPERQQTAMGRAKAGLPDATLKPMLMQVETGEVRAYSLDATPALCVEHCFRNLPRLKPRLIVAGINYGENVGSSITSSGTVGAALEGACLGIPAIAVSLETDLASHRAYTEQNWEVAEFFLQYFSLVLINKGLPAGVHALKIDIPARAEKSTPWRLSTMAHHSFFEFSTPNPSLANPLKNRVIAKRVCTEDIQGTDTYTVNVEHVISVTPLTYDMTARAPFPEVHAWLQTP